MSGLTELTEQQERILNYIEDCLERDQCPPTRKEIAAHFGFKSANSAETHLQALERKGRITVLSGLTRGIRLVPP